MIEFDSVALAIAAYNSPGFGRPGVKLSITGGSPECGEDLLQRLELIARRG